MKEYKLRSHVRLQLYLATFCPALSIHVNKRYDEDAEEFVLTRGGERIFVADSEDEIITYATAIAALEK